MLIPNADAQEVSIQTLSDKHVAMCFTFVLAVPDDDL
jgi:hypothetical protein